MHAKVKWGVGSCSFLQFEIMKFVSNRVAIDVFKMWSDVQLLGDCNAVDKASVPRKLRSGVLLSLRFFAGEP